MQELSIRSALLTSALLLGGWALAGIFISVRKRISLFQLQRQHLGFALLTVLICFSLHFTLMPVEYGSYKLLRMIHLATTGFLVLRLVVNHLVRRKDEIRKSFSAGITAVCALLFTLLVLEGIFLFRARTHGWAVTLAHLNWMQRYGGPYDSEGFRNDSATAKMVSAEKTVLLLGDSFLEGFGIAKVADRFSDLLNASNGDFYFLNRGKQSTDTRKQAEIYEQVKMQPAVVLLCWVPNDIFPAAEAKGYEFPQGHSYPGVPAVLKYVIQRSSLANYLYWMRGHDEFPGFAKLADGLFEDQSLLEIHLDDVLKIKARADSGGSKFAVVLFPYLNRKSNCTDVMEAKLKAAGVEVLNLAPVYSRYAPAEIVVNETDAHPNEFAHQLAADAISGFLKEKKWLK